MAGIQTRQVKIDLNKLRESKFFIATPCYGGALTEPYFRSTIKLMTWFNGHKVPLAFGTIANESLVTRARNVLLAYFLNSDYTHLMFIDADIEFQVDDILKLWLHDKDVVVGAYPKKGVNWSHIKESVILDPSKELTPNQIGALGSDYAINFKFMDRENKQVKVENGLIELHDAGTGFMMIKRKAIDSIIEHYPEIKYVNDVQMGGVDLKDKFYALFDTMIDPIDKRYLSEDYTFCRRWQEMKGQIWLDPSISLNHYGSFCFQGNPEMIISFDEPATTSSKSVTVDEKKEEMETIDLETL
tara:strand:+ start:265 stop:1164 length:900 start_codon:yes stop_codon:yes gene_type:complete